MIRIIRPATDEEKTVFREECEYCGTVFEYAKEDVHTGAYGCAFVYCPHCTEELSLDNEALEKHITPQNLVYPDDFYVHKDAVRISDDGVRKMIAECLDHVKGSDEDGWMVATGDRAVICQRTGDGMIEISVLQPVATTEIYEK